MPLSPGTPKARKLREKKKFLFDKNACIKLRMEAEASQQVSLIRESIRTESQKREERKVKKGKKKVG